MSAIQGHSDRWARLLTIDGRSLAACRIAIGAVLLADLLIRWRDIPAMMTDAGLFPREFMQLGPGQWSLHALSGDAAAIQILFVVHALAALMLLAGAWTRAATIACWLLAISLQIRNPLITNSGDALLRMTLFWGMFLPWGGRWSWDSRRRPPLDSTGPSWPAAAILLQLCLVYLVTGGLKLNQDWLQGHALGKLAALDFCARPLAATLANDWPALLSLASRIVPWLELAAPLLLWSPWRTATVRTIVVLAMIAFHGAAELLLHVGMFGLVSQACWLVFLPREFWDKIVGAVDESSVRPDAAASKPAGRARAAGAVCAAALLLVIAFNVECVWVNFDSQSGVAERTAVANRDDGLSDGDSGADDADSAAERRRPLAWLGDLGDALLLRQQWMMFQRPPEFDTWVVARADLLDGSQVDVLRGGTAWDDRGSPATARRLPSQHWRYFFRRLSRPAFQPQAPHVAESLLRAWNAGHGAARQAAKVTLVEFSERFGEQGFSTRVLGVARDGQADFDLEGALRDLDSLKFPE